MWAKAFVEEIAIGVALLLITIGLWRWVGYGALVVPGVVLLWIVLPMRRPFVDHRDPPAVRVRGRRET